MKEHLIRFVEVEKRLNQNKVELDDKNSGMIVPQELLEEEFDGTYTTEPLKGAQ